MINKLLYIDLAEIAPEVYLKNDTDVFLEFNKAPLLLKIHLENCEEFVDVRISFEFKDAARYDQRWKSLASAVCYLKLDVDEELCVAAVTSSVDLLGAKHDISRGVDAMLDIADRLKIYKSLGIVRKGNPPSLEEPSLCVIPLLFSCLLL